MYEGRRGRLLSRSAFLRRLANHLAAAAAVVVVSLGVGIAGYAGFEGLSPLDGFLNASMLLGGMGPVTIPATTGGKLFAGFYALYAGLVFLFAAGIIVAPVLHRALHHFHLDDERS
jgi:hypothetical protein